MARALLAGLCLWLAAASAAAEDEPAEIAGRSRLEWAEEARGRERAVARAEAALADCEEREAPLSYRNVPDQWVRGRDGYRVREIVRCDALEDELDEAREDLEDFEERARRLGVPPGWLR
jgi:hypothetical protein